MIALLNEGWESIDWVAALLVFGGIIAATAHYVLYNPKQKIIRQLKKSPPKQFYNIKEGEYVRLHGRVEQAAEFLESPLTETPCVFYRARIIPTGKNNGHEFQEEIRFKPFWLSNGMERVYVNPLYFGAVDHLLKKDLDSQSQKEKFSKERMTAFFDKYDDTYDLTDLLKLGEKMTGVKFTEAHILPGDSIAIKGIAKWKRHPETGKRFVEINASYKKRLLITDEPAVIRTLPK